MHIESNFSQIHLMDYADNWSDEIATKKRPLNCIMGKQYVTEETGRQQIFAAR